MQGTLIYQNQTYLQHVLRNKLYIEYFMCDKSKIYFRLYLLVCLYK